MGKWRFGLEGWPDFWGTIISATIAYSALILFIRISGKRSLSKMNVFDFVFVVALGTMLGNTVMSPDVPLLRGLLLIALLLLMQVTLSKVATCSESLEKLINGRPVYLFHDGKFLHDRMKRERVTEEVVRAAIRAKGYSDVQKIKTVVLETDGSLSVVTQKNHAEGKPGSLDDVVN